MERILAILTDEPEYACELASYLESRHDFIFRPMVFTDRETYMSFEQDNHVDMLLCPEDIAARNADYRAEHICVLSEGGIVGESSAFPSIFKYQSPEAIMKEIIDFYGKKQSHEAVKGDTKTVNGKRIISVFSPVGGSYKSTYALALAEYFSRGGRTLFVSFDPFFELPGEEKKATDKNLTDVIYFLEAKEAEPLEFIRRIAHRRGNLEYISGVSHWFDICDMKQAHMRRFIDSIISSDYYSEVVVDVGVMGASCMELLAAGSDIYLLTGNSRKSRARIAEWKRQLGFVGQSALLAKVCERNVPFDEMLDCDFSFENLLKGRVGHYIEETEGRKYIR